MRRSAAALGSAAFFVVAPGTVVGLIPWLITRWELHSPAPHWEVARVIGACSSSQDSFPRCRPSWSS